MQALTLTSFGGPEALELATLPELVPSAGQVVVAVAAAALGPWDLATTKGAFANAGGMTSFPQVVGWDFAGTVQSVGPDAGTWQPGDRVLGFTPQPWTQIGAFAEQVALPTGLLTSLPPGVEFTVAATLPVTSLTARLALDRVNAAAGTRILVVGAAGAVGSVVTQLASQAAVIVVASVSLRDASTIRGLGAAHTVDRSGDLVQQVRDVVPNGVDGCVDLVGGQAGEAAMAAIRDGGSFVTSVTAGLPNEERGISRQMLQVQPDPPALADLTAQVASGLLTTRVGKVVPFAEAPSAYRLAETGGLPGKVVLRMA